MNITVLNLCNAANAIYYNSEPHSWYTNPEGRVCFENENTKQVVFQLASDQTVQEHDNGRYAFALNDLNQTIWLDFYKEIPLLVDELQCLHA